MAPSRTISQEKRLALIGEGSAPTQGVEMRLRSLAATASGTRHMAAVRVPRPHRDTEDAVDAADATDGDPGGEGRSGAAVVPYSSPEAGFRGYTFEVGEALKDVAKAAREVKGGVAGPVKAVAELERAQEQRNEAFRLWLSGVMRREREMAKKAAFTVLKRRDQMLQEAGPDWFQQLSWDQMETANALQGAHRADAEEGSTARLALWCARIGVSPVPSARQLARALRRQPTDHEAFLLALYAVVSRSGKAPVPGDPPAPKLRTGFEFTPSERLLLSALAHLRLPHIVDKLDEEFGPPERHPRYLRISSEMPPPPARAERYLWPYLEPLPVPRMDWLELFSANHTAHLENLYMRSHKLPSTLIGALRPKPLPQVTLPQPQQAAKPRVRFRKQKAARKEKQSPTEDQATGVPPTEQGAAADAAEAAGTPSRRSRPARSASRTHSVGSPHRAPAGEPHPGAKGRAARKADGGEPAPAPSAPGVDPASVVSFLESLSADEPLCQLPDVHRIPAIQKWVRLRNGLLYVHRRLAEVLQDRSLVMWNANHLGMAYRVPTPKHGLSPRQVRELTWDRRDWYRRRVDKIMCGYNAALRTIQVNAAREMLPAMACDYFPARDKFLKTYFAYMPKHQMDMVVVRPWNPGEYNQEILRVWRDRYYQCHSKK